MVYPTELAHLKERFDVFTNKLMAKAKELQEETAASAQMVYDEDDDHYKRTYIHFKAGIEGQFRNIIGKAQDVFDTQIRPLRNDATHSSSTTIEWYSEMSRTLNDFEEKIYRMMKQVFDDVKEIRAEVHLQKILEEYQEIKNSFHCQQCGANLHIDQIYFVSTYIPCPYCQTQNTFVPGSRMTELQHLARDVAEERLETMQQRLKHLRASNASKQEQILEYMDYRAFVWLEKSKIVPVFKDEYAQVFYREIHDDLAGVATREIKLEPDMYKAVLNRLGFKHILKPTILEAYKNMEFSTVIEKLKDWEMLYELSSYTLLKIYQGESQKSLHDKHFQRIQSEWKLLTELNKGLASGSMTTEKVINEIENKL